MNSFTIRKITDTVSAVIDAGGNTFYVVEGEDLAAVIDTGISKDKKIMPVAREITDKPVVLLITHAHIDHIHHMDEFVTVYMCHHELLSPEGFLKSMMAGKNLDLFGTINISTGFKLELGGRSLEAFKVPGHTPGSLVFYDDKENLLFAGDAFGSGRGVWMQLPSSISLPAYSESLKAFIRWMTEKDMTARFLGGHILQNEGSEAHPGDNALSLGLVLDLLMLVKRVISGEIMGRDAGLPAHVAPNGALYAAYCRAELIYSEVKLG